MYSLLVRDGGGGGEGEGGGGWLELKKSLSGLDSNPVIVKMECK